MDNIPHFPEAFDCRLPMDNLAEDIDSPAADNSAVNIDLPAAAAEIAELAAQLASAAFVKAAVAPAARELLLSR